LVDVLLDLARYEDYALMTHSLHVVDLLYSTNADLTSLAVQAIVLTTPRSIGLETELATLLAQVRT
jgi:hypothetical protein